MSECADENKDHICDYCEKIIYDHTSGMATCTSKAVCDYCREEYGEFNTNNHADLKHVPAVSATMASKGNIECRYCNDCGKYFSDENTSNEITKEDTIIPKLAPSSIIEGGGAIAGIMNVSKKKK